MALSASVVEGQMRFRFAWEPSKADALEEMHDFYERASDSFELPGEAYPAAYQRMYDYEPDAGILNLALSATASFTRTVRLAERDIRAIRLMLRLEAYHAETGEWPADLSARELAELNTCPLTGKPFEYALTPGDEHGRAYTLRAPEAPWEFGRSGDYTTLRDPIAPAE